jgi:LPXTG-site transpeptidase (sortase) family protein
MARFLELATWTAGVLLLAAYFGLRTWSANAREEGVEAMREARAQQAAATESSAAPPAMAVAFEGVARTDFTVAEPDTSSWAAKRLAEYRASLTEQKVPAAVLRIPKLKLEVPVYEGTSKSTLDRGAGWIQGTAQVDSPEGNVGIAAHRDGFFRPLKDIAVGDALYLETVKTIRQYHVTSLEIVDPDDVGVLDETSASTVTLVTCYPFYFVGSAPKRFIVRAEVDQHGFAADVGQ